MSDNGNVENHTIRLLQEMRAEMDARFNSIDERFNGVDVRFNSLELQVYALDQRLGGLEPAMLKVIDAVTAIAKTQEQHTALLMTHTEKLTEIQRAQNVMEKDMRGIRGRVERIEDHIGLVKA